MEDDRAKKCIKCQKLKLLRKFYISKGAKDGHRNDCRGCCKARVKSNRKQTVSKTKTSKEKESNDEVKDIITPKQALIDEFSNMVNNCKTFSRQAVLNCGGLGVKFAKYWDDIVHPPVKKIKIAVGTLTVQQPSDDAAINYLRSRMSLFLNNKKGIQTLDFSVSVHTTIGGVSKFIIILPENVQFTHSEHIEFIRDVATVNVDIKVSELDLQIGNVPLTKKQICDALRATLSVNGAVSPQDNEIDINFTDAQITTYHIGWASDYAVSTANMSFIMNDMNNFVATEKATFDKDTILTQIYLNIQDSVRKIENVDRKIENMQSDIKTINLGTAVTIVPETTPNLSVNAIALPQTNENVKIKQVYAKIPFKKVVVPSQPAIASVMSLRTVESRKKAIQVASKDEVSPIPEKEYIMPKEEVFIPPIPIKEEPEEEYDSLDEDPDERHERLMKKYNEISDEDLDAKFAQFDY
jgi:hypothetical protein